MVCSEQEAFILGEIDPVPELDCGQDMVKCLSKTDYEFVKNNPVSSMFAGSSTNAPVKDIS